jgi:hypothetical protein
MKQEVKVEVVFDEEYRQENFESIEATFYRMFTVGKQQYAAFKKKNSFLLAKIVVVDGKEEFHDIENQAEFDTINDVFLQSEYRKQ